MAEQLTPDICVIGAGSGGLSVAAAAAAFGVPVVLIEKGRMGGECLNTGCVPSKAMIAAGRHAEALRSGDPFGVKSVKPNVEFDEVNDHVHRVINAIAPDVRLMQIMRGALPYVLCMVLAIVILSVFPEIATWLPDQMMGTRH